MITHPYRRLSACLLSLALVALGCSDETDYSGTPETETSNGTADSNNTTNNTASNTTGGTGTSPTGGTNTGGTGTGGTGTGGTSTGGMTNNGTTGSTTGTTTATTGGGNTSPTVGGGCLNMQDCGPNEFCIGASPFQGIEGYCTIINCETSSDCEFPQGGTFCCSNFGQTRGCFLELEGTTCGEEQGVQNDPCVEGGQSDCNGADDFYCAAFFGEESAICTEACNPASPGSCAEGTYCYPTAPDFGVCIPAGEQEEREPCADEPFGCAEGTICAFGALEDPYAYCAQICGSNIDCADNEWCQIYPGQASGTCQPLGDTPEGESCTEDRFDCGEGQICLYEGTRYARCASFCQRDSDCPDETFTCQIYDELNSNGICVQPGERETGELCGDDVFSCEEGAFCSGASFDSSYNPDAYCVADCTNDADVCPTGFACQDFDDLSYCQPDGDAQAGESCESGLDCAQGSFCITVGEEQFCALDCNEDSECEEGFYCTGDAEALGLCYPFGDIETGESCEEDPGACAENTFCGGPDPVCISECTDAPDSCPDGMFCLEPNINGQRFCYPGGTVASGGVCENPYDCEPNTFCTPQGGEEQPSICLPDCRVNDCPDGFWCAETPNWAQCQPLGMGTTGESCADSAGCADGHYCLYSESDQAYCARDCTGFANVCNEGEVCRYLGYGVNLCFPVGQVETGTSCGEDAQSCNGDALCVGVGFENAFCAQLCTFDTNSCPEGTSCVFNAGGLGTCLPPDFDPGDPIGDGGGPI